MSYADEEKRRKTYRNALATGPHKPKSPWPAEKQSMDRPAEFVPITAEDRKLLEGVGSFWSSRTAMFNLWRETDGSLWADPAEYAAWSRSDTGPVPSKRCGVCGGWDAPTYDPLCDVAEHHSQSDRGAEAEHLHWCACRIGKACNCRNVTTGDAGGDVNG